MKENLYNRSTSPRLLSLSKYKSVSEQRQPHSALATFNEVWVSTVCLVSQSLRLGGLNREAVLQLSAVRILVVDDFALFRQFIVELLGMRPEMQVVGEARDGLEAVHRAVELRPDVILLDTHLPNLNGVEVARQLRSLAPESKIIFLTHEFSADVVEDAFRQGARGYVTKTRAQADLFGAVEAVTSGNTFVSDP